MADEQQKDAFAQERERKQQQEEERARAKAEEAAQRREDPRTKNTGHGQKTADKWNQ